MAKKVLQINKFSGGVNSYSDPRDLKENEFQILDNAAVDEEGIIRVSGGLEEKDNINIFQTASQVNPSLYDSGEGLFGYSTDYYESIVSHNTYLQANGNDTSTAWGVTAGAGGTGGTWLFDAVTTNNSINTPSYFGIDQDSFAINYMTYSANTLENHGSLSFNGLNLKPGNSYSILFDCVNENPWYFLGSNIPPRIRLYNSTLGKYLYPDGFSDVSDATHTALISTAEGNLTADDNFLDDVSGSATTTQVPLDDDDPISGTAGHASYNSFFGTTATSGTTSGAAYLKLVSSASGGPFTSGNYTDSSAITVVAETTYLLDCIYNTNGSTTGTGGVAIRIINQADSSIIPFNNGTGEGTATSEWMHINAPPSVSVLSTPTPLEFTTPNGCTSIDIRIGVDNNGAGSADEAYFSGFNLRKKMYELHYLDEVSSHFGRFFASYKHPHSWGNEYGGTNSSPYLIHSNFNDNFRKVRKYRLNVTIPDNFDESNDWSLSLEAGIWSGLNQTGVNNFIVNKIDMVDIDLYQSVLGNSYNIVTQDYNTDNNDVTTDVYNYNPIDKVYNKINYLTMPSLSNSCFRFIKGSKFVYFCDKYFNNSNLYSLRRDSYRSNLQINSHNYTGPSITHSTTNSTIHGVNPDKEFNVKDDYLGKNNTSVSENNMYIAMISSDFWGGLENEVRNELANELPTTDYWTQFDKFNQCNQNSNTLEHDVAHGTGSGMAHSSMLGFKYDMDDSEWKDANNPYTKYIVIRNDDIHGTTDDKLLASSRIAKVTISLQNWIAFPSLSEGCSLVQDYVPNMKIYLDVVNATAADSTFFSVPGDANFVKTIGEVEVNPNNYSVGDSNLDGNNNFYNTTPTISSNEWFLAGGDWSTDSEYEHTGGISFRFKKPDTEGINYENEYENITIDIPYTMTDGSSAITVGGSGTNLQLRFVPKVDPSVDLWHAGNGPAGESYYTNRYHKLGILSEEWWINKIILQSYLNNDANTEDSFGHIETSSIQTNVVFETPSTGEADGWDDEWTIYLTSIDKDDIESAIGTPSYTFFNTDVTKCPRIDIITDISNETFNSSKFIKGYMTSKRNNNYNLQFIIDCNKKTIKSSTSGKIYHAADFSNIRQYTIPSKDLLIPNEIDSYESETGVLIENAENPNKMIATFKTAVIANSTLYAGNVYQDGVHYPDRMLKSPIGKVPLLPSTNFIDVAINDGDEIVSLQFYKDRLLQFKKNKLFIISTSEDYEYLLDTIENVGISQESQVVMTPYGVTWINSRGCYLYDGQKVNYLIDNKLGYRNWKDSESSWEIDEKYGASIGYLKKDDKLIIYGATDSLDNIKNKEDYTETSGIIPTPYHYNADVINKGYLRKLGYQFDFQTKSWSNLTHFTDKDDNLDGYNPILDGKSRVPWSQEMVTNFSYDENGDSILLIKPENKIFIWDDYPKKTLGESNMLILDSRNLSKDNRTNRDFRIITKDYDFGAPSVRKKIYKVYVTFKSTELESSKIAKRTQLQDFYNSSNVGVYYSINGKNIWTEFSETKSINYGTKGLISDDAETTTTTSGTIGISVSNWTLADASNIKEGYVLRMGTDDNDEQVLVKSVSGNNITVARAYNHTETNTYSNGTTVYISTGDWIVAELKPSSSINNIDSFKLKFETKHSDSLSNEDNGVPSGFMINDISVIYRIKNVR